MLNSQIKNISKSLYQNVSVNKKLKEITQIQQQEQQQESALRVFGKISQLNINFCNMEFYSNPQFGVFLYTLILTLSLQFLVLKFVFSGIHFYLGGILCAYILYLLVSLALSNPGFAVDQYEAYQMHKDLNSCESSCQHHNERQKFRYFCNICRIQTKVNTKHCNICDVCVYDYDHHCVFIGKCIAGNNIGRFQQFLFFIFATLIYSIISAFYQIPSVKQIK